MALVTCPDCKNQVSDHAPACPHCGRPTASVVFCKKCGKQNDSGSESCINCGRPLTDARPATATGAVADVKKTSPLVVVGAIIAVIFILGLLSAPRKNEDKAVSPPDTSATSGERPSQKVEPEIKLELISWNFTVSETGSFVHVKGQVKNVSNEPLRNVTAVASFYDSSGNFITSDQALIEYNPIMPAQISPFEVTETHNPLMKRAQVEFKELLGGTIPYKENTKSKLR